MFLAIMLIISGISIAVTGVWQLYKAITDRKNSISFKIGIALLGIVILVIAGFILGFGIALAENTYMLPIE